MRVSTARLALLFIFCGPAIHAISIDREAFTFTKYDLNVQVDPEQQRLGVRGRVTLRNDSQLPQKIAVLQISSSLDWRSIKVDDKTVQFVSQPYTSDIDHTAALSEAIVTLPSAVPPRGTVDLEIAYEGVIVLDATRLTRIGTPEAVANSSDWDEINAKFTAVRGAGYVTWYPIATEAADISEPNDLSDILARWKTRHADTEMSFLFESTDSAAILFSGNSDLFTVSTAKPATVRAFSMVRLGINVPTFVIADYAQLEVKGTSTVDFPRGRDAIAAAYGEVLGSIDPFGSSRGSSRLQVVALPNPDATPFATESMLLTPLRATASEDDKLTLTYALAREEIRSRRPWVVEGLAHFAQVREIERLHGRRAALDYLKSHSSILVESAQNAGLPSTSATGDHPSAAPSRPVIDMTDQIDLQSKAMCIWWMLYDMMGDLKINLILSTYEPLNDKEPTYTQKMLEQKAQRDLQWFFDDWVYHDRGLPDFKVESAIPRKNANGSFIYTISVLNLGSAGAEVPVTVKFAGGEVTKRLEVRGKSRGVIRMEIPSTAQEIVVNDGSVPESDVTNNVLKVETTDAPK